MKNFNFNVMRGGWFVGDFFPCALNWKGGEISVKHFPKGHIEVSYLHKNAAKYYVVIKGAMMIDGQIIKEDQIACIEPGEDLPLIAVENTVVMLCVVGDRTYTRFNLNVLADELKIYDSVYPHMKYDGFIDYKDISVVVQGAVEKNITPVCMESIRRFFPGSRIILSTWEGSHVEGIDYDELVLNKDPGGYKYTLKSYHKEFTNNVNRQLISIQNGLRKVESKYVLKLRTDMILTTNEFLRYFDLFSYKTNEYCLFQKKILVADFYTRHSLRCERGFIPTPFHVSDWFFFGLSEDVKEYFMKTGLMTEEEQVKFLDIKRTELRDQYDYCWYWRFPPEQYYGVEAAGRRFPDIRMHDWSDWNEELLKKSEKFIMNNFVVLDFTRHGINLPKYEMNITSNCGQRRYYEKGLYTYEIYKKIYEAICEGKDIPVIWDERTDDDQDFWMFRKEEGANDKSCFV